jgi:carbonic anhydrase
MFDIIYRYDPRQPSAVGPPADPTEARQRLEFGNREFAHMLDPVVGGEPHLTRIVPFDPADLGVGERPDVAPTQKPFAVVLSCCDARVPTEIVFDQACNTMFVVRVAGNVLGSECLGSIDYAVAHLGSSVKLLVVLGHSGCGAVTAAVDAFLQPARYLAVASSHQLRAIVDRLFVSVRGAARCLEEAWGPAVAQRPQYRRALIETSVMVNAVLTAATIKQEFRGQVGPNLDVVCGVYDLVTRHVRLPRAESHPTGDAEVCLISPPEHPDDLAKLGFSLAGSDVVRELLTDRPEARG